MAMAFNIYNDLKPPEHSDCNALQATIGHRDYEPREASPTDAPPGSKSKVKEMAKRYLMGVELTTEGDTDTWQDSSEEPRVGKYDYKRAEKMVYSINYVRGGSAVIVAK